MKKMGITELRNMNGNKLRNLDEPIEICDQKHQPVRVLIPYGTFTKIQIFIERHVPAGEPRK